MTSNHLLPPNATRAEIAISETIARAANVPVRTRDVWNYATCPVAVLPWLAWAVSVDEWDSTWSEAQKRAAIAAAREVHRIKGTRGAVRRAIEATGVNAELSEWFEHSGDPYTFKVEIGITQESLSRQHLLRLLRVIDSAKNLRSRLAEATIRTTSEGRSYIAGGVFVGSHYTIKFVGDPA